LNESLPIKDVTRWIYPYFIYRLLNQTARLPISLYQMYISKDQKVGNDYFSIIKFYDANLKNI